jgi:hypothetical protein
VVEKWMVWLSRNNCIMKRVVRSQPSFKSTAFFV